MNHVVGISERIPISLLISIFKPQCTQTRLLAIAIVVLSKDSTSENPADQRPIVVSLQRFRVSTKIWVSYKDFYKDLGLLQRFGSPTKI